MELTFNRIIIFGKDIEGLKNFYMNNFKFELIEEIKDEWVVLKKEKMEMAFHKIGDAYMSEDDKPFKVETNCKFVFEIYTDIIKLRDALIQNEVNMRELNSFNSPEYISCDGEDIEGNVFQIKQKKN